MSEFTPCPICHCEYTYPSDDLLVCSECFHEWNPNDAVIEDSGLSVLDVNGNVLQNGDTVLVVKDLPVKGAPKPIKAVQK